MQFHCIVHSCIQEITNQPKKITCNICHQVGVILEKFFRSLHTLNTNIYTNIHKPIKEQLCQKLKGVHSNQQCTGICFCIGHHLKKKKEKKQWAKFLPYQQQTQLIKSKSTWSSGECILGKITFSCFTKNFLCFPTIIIYYGYM